MKICRVCMQGEDEEFISIFSKLNGVIIADTIAKSCSVQLAQDDGLPNQICHTCIQEVQRVASFTDKVRESDLKLRQLKHEETFTMEVVVIKTEMSDDICSTDNVAADNVNSDYESVSESDEPKQNRKNNRDEDYVPTSKRVSVKRRQVAKVPSDDESGEETEKEQLDDKESEMFQIITLQEESFVCCYCYQFFDNSEQLESHVEVHKKHAVKNTDSIYCTVCKRRFNKTAALNRHQKMVKALKKLYECKKCKKRFMNSNGRRIHAEKHPHNIEETMKLEYGEIICCARKCSKPFSSEELLIKHAHEAHQLNKRAYGLEDASLKPSECPVCYKRFPSERLLRRHRKRNSKPLGHQCAACGLKFRTKDVLSIHELNHADQRPFKCDICQNYFSSKSALKVHQRIHSSEKPFICATCGLGFYQKAQLAVHAQSHNDAPLPFPCDVCDKSFKAKTYLVHHMRHHTGERPYPCRHCPMAFAHHSTRQKHEMNHTGIKPFKCSYCEKTFTLNRLKVEHESRHTGIKQFKCSHCDKTFIRKQFQIDHETTHTGVKPYQCKLCNSGFSHDSGLRRHMRTHALTSDDV